jgi:hypothetical protein
MPDREGRSARQLPIVDYRMCHAESAMRRNTVDISCGSQAMAQMCRNVPEGAGMCHGMAPAQNEPTGRGDGTFRRTVVVVLATACNAMQPGATPCNRSVELEKRTHRERAVTLKCSLTIE